MQEEYIVFGNFRGSFYTEQGSVLDYSKGFPMDSGHAVHLYKGYLTDVSFEGKFEPEQYRKLSSFVLENVPNIEIESSDRVPFAGKRLYNLSNLVIVDPKVIKTFELNGKTYGEIESKAYGVTERYPLLSKLNPDEPPPRPALVDEDFDRSTGGGSKSDDQVANDNNNQDVPSPPPIPVLPPVPDRSDGCRPYLQGCLANFWTLIGIFLLLMLLISVFKKIQTLEDQCMLKEKERILRDIAKEKLDSIKIEYEKNFEEIMVNSFKVYFYKNSSDFELSALSNIQRLQVVISAYKDKQFVIEGYHSGIFVENIPEIDKRRAEHLRDTLIQLGIPSSQLTIQSKGSEPQLDPLSTMSKSFVPGGGYLEYNQNMRVEVKPVKK